MNLREIFESSSAGHNVAICYGRWNPPHKGHRAAWETAAEFGTFYIGTNHNTQGKDDPLPYDVKLECMATIWPDVAGHVIPEQNVFSLAVAVYNKHGEHTHLKVCTDELWLASGLEKYNGKEAAHGYFKFASIQHVATPRLSSATKLRDAVRNGDREEFAQAAGVPADTAVGDHSFFDLVAHYLNQFPIKVKKAKKEKDVAETSPMDLEHGSGKELQSDPAYKREVRRTKQSKLAQQTLADRVKAGYDWNNDKDEWGQYKTVNIKEANRIVREMRAREFIQKDLKEDTSMPTDSTSATPGMKTWPALDNNNSPYSAYRFGVIMAGAGPRHDLDPDNHHYPPVTKGPVGGQFITLGYTKGDEEILDVARKQMGVKSVKKTEEGSFEEEDTNTVSPVAKPKKNKYGI